MGLAPYRKACKEVIIDRKIATDALAALTTRLLLFALQLLACPLILNRFGFEALGLWTILANLTFCLSLFDFGIGGAALRNQLAAFGSRSGQARGRLHFLAVVQFSLCLHGVLILALSLMASIDRLLFWALLLMLIRAPFSLSEPALFSFGEVKERQVFTLIEGLSLAVALWVGATFFSVVIIWQSLCTITSVAMMVYFLWRRSWRWAPVSLRVMGRIIKRLAPIGLSFWLIGLLHLFFSSQQPLIIAYHTSLKEAGEFSLFFRLFSSAMGLHFTWLTPLWSAYTRAQSRGDRAWMRSHFKQSLAITLILFSLFPLLLAPFHPLLFKLWAKSALENHPLLWATAGWALLLGCGNCCATLLNGLGRIKEQLIALIIGIMIHWLLAPFLADSFKATGVMLTSLISLLPYTIWTTRCAFSLLKSEISVMSR